MPGEIDAYLKDRFGLRRVLIRAHKDLTRPVLGPGGGPVLIGRDGRMFYLGDEMVRQSAGLVLRDQKVSDVVDLLGADEGRAGASRRQASRRHAAEFLHDLPGRSSGLGAEPGQDDRIRPVSFSRSPIAA